MRKSRITEKAMLFLKGFKGQTILFMLENFLWVNVAINTPELQNYLFVKNVEEEVPYRPILQAFTADGTIIPPMATAYVSHKRHCDSSQRHMLLECQTEGWSPPAWAIRFCQSR